MTGISFVVITDGKEPAKVQAQIDSIKALAIPEYEVLVVRDKDLSGKLGKLRNAGCNAAIYDVLVVSDDDMIFHDDFYSGLLEYSDDFEVLSCRILNPNGTRYWDWKEHINGKNQLLEYGTTSPHVSLTGGLTIMKREVFDRVKWDETLVFYQAEDVDFSERLKEAGIDITFNPNMTVTHDDDAYTQNGNVVVRR
jgi:GT2 family glycosyltransferase